MSQKRTKWLKYEVYRECLRRGIETDKKLVFRRMKKAYDKMSKQEKENFSIYESKHHATN